MTKSILSSPKRDRLVRHLHMCELAIIGLEPCGQSYNHFTIVNYDSSVVIWGIFKSGMTLEA